MAQNAENTFPAWLHYFDQLDSTNNYAMRRIDDGLAQHGEVIQAAFQKEGKGQRGKKWANDRGNLMMSLIVKPNVPADRQFVLSMATACTLARYLQAIGNGWQVAIKWPNDIYVNDKKACGVLIENIFRGMDWAYAVIGIGLNVNQASFPRELGNATSLAMASGRTFDLREIMTDIRSGLLNRLRQLSLETYPALLQEYNQHLFRLDKKTGFRERASGRCFEAYVEEVDEAGRLVLLSHQGIETFNFGTLDWVL